MDYIVKTFGKSIIKISEEDFRNIGGKSSGMVYTRDGRSFNLSSVDSIIPESDYALEKANKNSGVLHDGQNVVKKFGSWVLMSDEEVKIDTSYYPEILQDCVPTIQEYEQKYKSLTSEDRLTLMLDSAEHQRASKELRSGEGFKRLSAKTINK